MRSSNDVFLQNFKYEKREWSVRLGVSNDAVSKFIFEQAEALRTSVSQQEDSVNSLIEEVMERESRVYGKRVSLSYDHWFNGDGGKESGEHLRKGKFEEQLVTALRAYGKGITAEEQPKVNCLIERIEALPSIMNNPNFSKSPEENKEEEIISAVKNFLQSGNSGCLVKYASKDTGPGQIFEVPNDWGYDEDSRMGISGIGGDLNLEVAAEMKLQS